MTRLLTLTAAALALSVARPARATLVMASSYLGPHGPGVVVACDRRATRGDAFIDGVTKIHVTPRALFSVTGCDRLYPTPSSTFYIPDAISHLVGDRPVQSMIDVAQVARALVADLPPLPEQPGAGGPEDDDGGFFRVSFYSPSLMGTFVVTSRHGVVTAHVDGAYPVAPYLALTTELSGQPHFFGSVVRPLGFLSAESTSLIDHPPPTREVTFDAAERFVIDVIMSSERAAETHRPRWGIGGGVDVYAIDSAGPRHLLTTR